MQIVLRENEMHEGENKVHEVVNNMWRWEIKDYGGKPKTQKQRREKKG